MTESIVTGVLLTFTPSVMLAILVGVIIGLIFGLAPGIGVAPIMAIIVPLTYGMDPTLALSLLVALHAVGATGGSVTAILLNIPGTAINAATIFDGFPMTKKGLGGRAVGAALCSSALGGLFGAIVLALMIPLAHAIVLGFGSPENLMVVLLGLAFIAVLSKGSTLKGMISGLMGIFLSFIGLHAITGEPRFTFGIVYFYEGIPVIPFVLGMFALTEVLDLILQKGGAIVEKDKASLASTQWPQVWEGVKDVFRHWDVFLRGSITGTLIGLVPGVGGETAVFVAYGQAKATSKHPERFGQGAVEGVIAPEAANNSKEGGSMLPTLAFGIPGSLLMAILLSAMTIHGIAPGPGMLKEHLALTWSLISCLIISNILGAAMLLPFVGMLAKIAFVRITVLNPLILVIAAFGAYAFRTDVTDIALTFLFGGLGYAMIKTGYNRIAMLLGLILGSTAEKYIFISYQSMKLAFLTRPLVLFLMALTFLLLSFDWLRGLFGKVMERNEK